MPERSIKGLCDSEHPIKQLYIRSLCSMKTKQKLAYKGRHLVNFLDVSEGTLCPRRFALTKKKFGSSNNMSPIPNPKLVIEGVTSIYLVFWKLKHFNVQSNKNTVFLKCLN